MLLGNAIVYTPAMTHWQADSIVLFAVASISQLHDGKQVFSSVPWMEVEVKL
jgi:hypothetical protein